MRGRPPAPSDPDLQLRIIRRVASIDDPDVLARLERIIDAHRSGLRRLDDAEVESILADLRPGANP
jgi:hypothetical protein